MKPQLFIILENIRSAHNVGSVFRTCDAAGVAKLYLTGYCPYPPHPKLEKTALGAIQTVPWEHHSDTIQLIKQLKEDNVQIVSAEITDKSNSVFKSNFTKDTCIILGNEKDGVSQDALNLSDQVIHIPQFGKKDSLNISVAAGIVIYEYVRKSLTNS